MCIKLALKKVTGGSCSRSLECRGEAAVVFWHVTAVGSGPPAAAAAYCSSLKGFGAAAGAGKGRGEADGDLGVIPGIENIAVVV
jgi:hypothetical protein